MVFGPVLEADDVHVFAVVGVEIEVDVDGVLAPAVLVLDVLESGEDILGV